MNSNQSQLDFIVQSKERYRTIARAQTWEEKVASIERMRRASKQAKESMNFARDDRRTK